jgi:3-dehydroquinate dehydratase, type I
VAKKTVKLGKIELGAGKPKIAVPITGKNEAEIIKQAENIYQEQPDLVEWRIDFFDGVTDKNALKEAGQKLRQALKDLPILTTFRTKGEGGELDLSDEKYFEICQNVLDIGQTDALDIERYHDETMVKNIVDAAKKVQIATIMSNHDFHKTPDQDDIVSRLTSMVEIGADVAKIAVMPQSTQDVLTLLSATNEANEKLSQPVITMSMGDLGKVSRIAGEVFGSAITFATVGKASAPGQIPIVNLRNDLSDLHLN